MAFANLRRFGGLVAEGADFDQAGVADRAEVKSRLEERERFGGLKRPPLAYFLPHRRVQVEVVDHFAQDASDWMSSNWVWRK